jgi:peptidoglycan hydrolase CwlO-like protein
METELKSLEEKISLLLRMYQDTRVENKKLQTELANSHHQCEKLNEKIHVAVSQLEVLLLNIPENE